MNLLPCEMLQDVVQCLYRVVFFCKRCVTDKGFLVPIAIKFLLNSFFRNLKPGCLFFIHEQHRLSIGSPTVCSSPSRFEELIKMYRGGAVQHKFNLYSWQRCITMKLSNTNSICRVDKDAQQ